MFVCALCLYPTTPCRGVQFVCSSAGFGFTQPIVAGVCDVCVCLGSGFPFILTNLVVVLGFPFLCARCACSPAFLAGVCAVCVRVRVLASRRSFRLGFVVFMSGYRFSLSPRQSSLRCCSPCVCVRGPPVCRQSWVGSAVCVFECRFWLQPANPGCRLRWVCSGGGFDFTPPFLARVCGVCVWGRVFCSVHPLNPQGALAMFGDGFCSPHRSWQA